VGVKLDESVARLLDDLLPALRASLADEALGVYLYGSAVAGDFDPEVSDVDLLVAVRVEVCDERFFQLKRMYDQIEERHPDWVGRIDSVHVPLAALANFAGSEHPIVVITPGESLHRTTTSPGWLMNWHSVRESGVALFGPPPREWIATTTGADFLEAVRVHMNEMPARTASSPHRQFQAYAVLTGCRALHVWREGGQLSKRRAADWAVHTHPEWADIIRAAQQVRLRRGEFAPTSFRDDAVSFLEFVRIAISEAPPV
jgi:predicted nucleotidyltransferase